MVLTPLHGERKVERRSLPWLAAAQMRRHGVRQFFGKWPGQSACQDSLVGV